MDGASEGTVLVTWPVVGVVVQAQLAEGELHGSLRAFGWRFIGI